MNKEVKEKFNKNKENMDFYNQDGTQDTNNQKKRFTKKPRPQKIKPISFTYTSKEEGAFFDVLDHMCNCYIVSTFMENALQDYTAEEVENLTEDDYFTVISAHVINTAMPQLLSKKFIHTVLNVSANKIYVRTEGNVAFSFELKYNVVDKVAVITECIGTITLFAKNDQLVFALEENGFTKVEK